MPRRLGRLSRPIERLALGEGGAISPIKSSSKTWLEVRKLISGWTGRANYLLGTSIPAEYDEDLTNTIRRVRRFTMTSAQRIAALCDAASHLVHNRVEGDFVECGVWKGGSMMAVALTLVRLGAADRHLYLFDTYTGMPAPTERDVFSPYDGYSPQKRWRRITKRGGQWSGVPVHAVQAAMLSTAYPPELIHLVPGKVEETLPQKAPRKIALLRLDTDWYESTKHEMKTLYPRLVRGGVLILDDYGHYDGARRAVDEYFAENGNRILLNRIDYTGRIGTK